MVRSVATVLTVLLLGVACTPDPSEPVPSSPAEPAIRVGAGPQAELQLLAAVVVALLAGADVPAEVVVLADAADARRALELGDVDVLPSYTGEAWLEVLGRADPPSDQATSLARVAEFDEREGLLWLRPRIAGSGSVTEPPADATFAFVVSPAAVPAGEDPPGTLSQLAVLLGRLERHAVRRARLRAAGRRPGRGAAGLLGRT